MKRKLVGAISLLVLALGLAHADPYGGSKTPQELADFFGEMKYQTVESSKTAVGASLTTTVTYYGYATDLSIKANGGTIHWCTNWSTVNTTGTLFSGDSISLDHFDVPASSPTQLTVTLQANSTAQIHIGGKAK